METSLIEALRLLGVGMITVVTILSLVVLSGRTLIWVVNRYFPVKRITADTGKRLSAKEENTEKAKLAAIVTSVEIYTAGKGKVQSITPRKQGSTP